MPARYTRLPANSLEPGRRRALRQTSPALSNPVLHAVAPGTDAGRIARAERVEPHVNAFAEELFEQALRAAAAAERRYLPGGRPRLLEGLPPAA
ncbi:hypothetical protein [Streptomyces anthocyanicus]|uniref:hypothetical protein n=1 Tax=Streptomyces anthocyanicus TaxID=68174 RepID=UPI0037FB7FFA